MKNLSAKLRRLISDKNDRALLANILLAFLIRGISLLVSLFSMPLYVRYFDNNDILGIWYTILSVLSWISLCDLGLSSGLRNSFTVAYTRGDTDQGKKYICSTYVSLTFIILPIAAIGALLLPFADLNGFLNIPPSLLDKRSLLVSVIILLFGVTLHFVLKTVQSVIYAIQKPALNNCIALVVSLLPLFYILFAPTGTPGENLIRLSVVHVIAINLPYLAASVWLFAGKYRDFAPALHDFDFSVAKKMLGMGMKFFAAQVFFMFLMSTNEIFITRFFSADDVVEYSMYYKIFMLVGSLFMLALTPLWSRVTKDLEEKNYRKIYSINKILYALSLLAMAVEMLLIPFLQWIFDVWMKEKSIPVTVSTAFVFALFGGLYICNIVLTTVANGMGELKTQAIVYGIGALLKIPGVFLLKTVFPDWSCIILYNCAVLAVFCAIQFGWVNKRIKSLLHSTDKT